MMRICESSGLLSCQTHPSHRLVQGLCEYLGLGQQFLATRMALQGGRCDLSQKVRREGSSASPGLRWEMENLALCLYSDPLLDASSFLGLVEPPGQWHHGFRAYRYCWNTKTYTWSWDGWLTNKIKNSPWLPQLSMFIGSRTRKMFNLDTLNTLKSLFHFAFPHARKWCVYS